MGNIGLNSGTGKDQDWYKWFLNHDFRRWCCVENFALARASVGAGSKGRERVRAGRQAPYPSVSEGLTVSVVPRGRETLTAQADQVHFLQSISWQILTASSCQK